jgi:hypothetical protein
MYMKCFLFQFSGLPRSAFDNKSVSFEEHIKIEHNMWHYLNFIVLVKVKKSTEFTGPESYVSEMVKVKLSSFSLEKLIFTYFIIVFNDWMMKKVNDLKWFNYLLLCLWEQEKT